MDAITLNWLWYSAAFAALAFLMLRWYRLSPGHGDRRRGEARPSLPTDDGDSRLVPVPPPSRPVTTLDPVSGERLRMKEALAYFYRGRVYFFACEQTRARFAASPHLYAPEMTAERSIKPELGALVGVCTHLGCIPAFRRRPGAADVDASQPGGFYCPRHGSKFDLAGRVFKNVPAPNDLTVPPHHCACESRLLIGVGPDIGDQLG